MRVENASSLSSHIPGIGFSLHVLQTTIRKKNQNKNLGNLLDAWTSKGDVFTSKMFEKSLLDGEDFL